MRYEVNISRLENPSGNIRGFVNVVFNNCFKVSNIAVVEGKEKKIVCVYATLCNKQGR